MLTENLVKLFGGNNDKPKKNNNMTIIIVVVIVVCLCSLLLGGGYIMTNKKNNTEDKKEDKKEENKEDKKEEKKEDKKEEKIDHCAKYNDDSKDYSLECVEQLWKNTGCTVDFKDNMKSKMDESKSKGEPTPSLSQLKQGFKMFKQMEYAKEMCYGPDKSKWPVSKCSEYKQDSTNISDECLTELYSAGCPAFNMKNMPEDYKKKDIPFGMIQMGAVLLPMEGDEKNRTLCYGSDKSKWPPVCSHFMSDDAQMISKECIEDMWKKAGCTKPVSIDYDSTTKMSQIKTRINDISTSTDPAVKSKC